MFEVEQKKAIDAIREAEQNSTKIHMFETQTEEAKREVRSREN